LRQKSLAAVETLVEVADDKQSPAGARVSAARSLIDHSNLWSRMLALEHGELLPENQVFQ